LIILFDLDDTLLENSMETFLPVYLKLLSEHLANEISPTKLPGAILNGTEFMVNNVDPAKTLEECFDGYFYSQLNHSKESLIEKIHNFYTNEFPKLKPLTNQVPHAATVIQELKANNHKLVIATNPLFPKMAIDHRINWAHLGLSLSDYEYITNYEELHFTKPRSEFIAEILGKIGWPDEPVVMVGNEWEMDILPAEQLGIPTFFIRETPLDYSSAINPLSSSGPIRDLLDWINNLQIDNQTFDGNNPFIALPALLRATAANVDTYQRMNIPIEIFKKRPKSDEWSIVEIISHMADVDLEVNIPRLQKIQTQSSPFIEAALTDQWAEERQYIKNDPIQEINRFVNIRKKLIEIIAEFNSDFWNKSVNHAIFGPTTVSELIKFIAQHDRIHISQIVNTLKEV
jgi:FMN phosphatase YigB (HAD superfamily)